MIVSGIDILVEREYHSANDMCDAAITARLHYINQNKKVLISLYDKKGYLLSTLESYEPINL